MVGVGGAINGKAKEGMKTGIKIGLGAGILAGALVAVPIATDYLTFSQYLYSGFPILLPILLGEIKVLVDLCVDKPSDYEEIP